MLTDTSYWIARCSAVVGTSPDIHSDNEFASDLHQTICDTKDSQSLLLTNTAYPIPVVAGDVHRTICDTQDTQALLLTDTTYPIACCIGKGETSPDIYSENENCKHSLPPKQPESVFSVLTQSLWRCLKGPSPKGLSGSEPRRAFQARGPKGL